MLPRLDASITPPAPIRAAVPVEAAGDARQEAFQRSLHTLLGKSMQGEVLARFADGNFLVKVAGTAARMQLPPGARVGGEVPLTLIAIDPRPTFQIGKSNNPGAPQALSYAYADAAFDPPADDAAAAARPGAQSAQGAAGARSSSLAAALLGKAPLTPASLLPDLGAGAPAPALSSAARAINSVLMQAESVPGAPLALVGKAALLAPPAADPAQLAQTLHDEVGHSGLFYESHVAEWAEGKRSMGELLREPQMAQTAAGQDPLAKAAAGTDLAAAQLINLQLHTHEQQRVLWQGEVWPGQQMEWEIRKDEGGGRHGEAGDDDEAQAAWRSGVRFHFPQLGSVSATLVLTGGQVHIQLQADSEQSRAALRAGTPALGLALDAAGAPLASLTIGQPDGAGDAQ
ncbi:flagellar hook-length control protein FliK [Janthinobacterium fluminis]|uniref:Flagellar hook-length control protein FliK n=1 Tax=Janthinobacterium fluminis TaxID=2987524 RepID=A0ABT5K2U8_9BURK|nr:flagellar hook-length control protein FliK [Janthinobacterium fluminis]MDC8759302.1 flagellar hook-length control protein FliK [Janthinobacterium fluminis]